MEEEHSGCGDLRVVGDDNGCLFHRMRKKENGLFCEQTNKAPYELVDEEDEDMKALFAFMKMDLIPPDEVHLKADLFRKNK